MHHSSSTRLFASRLDMETGTQRMRSEGMNWEMQALRSPATLMSVSHMYTSKLMYPRTGFQKGRRLCSTHTGAPTFPPQPERCSVLEERDVETHTSRRRLKGSKIVCSVVLWLSCKRARSRIGPCCRQLDRDPAARSRQEPGLEAKA